MSTVFDESWNISEPIDQARLLASPQKESLKWLQVIPSSKLGLLMNDVTTRIAVTLRLGSRVCEQHICRCGKIVEENGYHGLSCTYSAQVISQALTSLKSR